MKRPRNHIIEEESQRELINLIPSSWVNRKLNPDYGLDYLIEIFVDEKSTGNTFFVQLKGSDQDVLNDTFAYDVKIEHLKYYKTIATPVLLILYSTRRRLCWALWINALFDSLHDEEKKQTTVQIRLGKEKIINTLFFENLGKWFSNDLSSKINIQEAVNDTIGQLYHKKICDWLKYYYKDEITFGAPFTPNSILLNYSEVSPDNKLSISTSYSNQYTRVSEITMSRDSRFIYYPILDTNSIPDDLAEILIVLASILKSRNIKSSAKILISTLSTYKGEQLALDIILDFGKLLVEKELIELLDELMLALLNAKQYRSFQWLNSSILLFDDKRLFVESYQKNILIGLKEIDNNLTKAALSYNLANSFRTAGQFHKAPDYYQLARKFDSSYTVRSYWWYEFAGVLFLLNHYRISEKFYKKSIELDGGNNYLPLTYSLIGDCQFHQGKFLESENSFTKYLDNCESPMAEYLLKQSVSQNFVDIDLDSIKFDLSKSSKLTEEATRESSSKKFMEAISAFPLNGHAWFNYGVLLEHSSKPEEAFTAFLTTACIQRWDIESWKNCLLLSFKIGHEMSVVVCQAAIYIKGDSFINYCSDHILDQENMTTEQKTTIIAGLNQLKELKFIYKSPNKTHHES